ncbi:hypothetical protein ES703_70175 [subsurface metagenome]
MVLHCVRVDNRAFDCGREFSFGFQSPELGINIFGPSVGGNCHGAFPGPYLSRDSPARPRDHQKRPNEKQNDKEIL